LNPHPPKQTPDLGLRRALCILKRGLRRRCPQCGRGTLFRRWYSLHDRCPICDLDLTVDEESTWAFMYLSTALMIGLFGIVLFIAQAQAWHAVTAGVLPLALVAVVASLPFRKGLALALEYLMNVKWDAARRLEPRFDDQPRPPDR